MLKRDMRPPKYTWKLNLYKKNPANPSISSRVNKVTNEINKLILKSFIKTAILEYSLKKTELMLNNLLSSQNVHNLKGLT